MRHLLIPQRPPAQELQLPGKGMQVLGGTPSRLPPPPPTGPPELFLTVVSFLRAAMRSSQVAVDFSKASCRLSSFSTPSTVCP